GSLQAVAPAELGKVAIVVVGEQVCDRPAEVPQESLAHLPAVDNVARDDGQERQGIVAAPPPELLAELRCPVLRADLVAVDEGVVERAPGQRAYGAQDRRHLAGPVGVERLAAELVALQAASFGRRGVVLLARRRIADAQNGPYAFGRVPRQAARRVH